MENGIVKMCIDVEWGFQSTLVLPLTLFIVFLPSRFTFTAPVAYSL